MEAREKDKVLYTVWKPVSSMTYITMAARFLKLRTRGNVKKNLVP